jgi:hypothetical protein
MLAAARRLALDQGTGETVAALARAGVPTVLLKGPAIRYWLYGPRHPRTYCDCDLLVRRDDFGLAERVLVSLGFDREFSDEAVVRSRNVAAHTWLRSADHTRVDLHRALEGADADADVLWTRLFEPAVSIVVGGVEVLVPDRRGMGLIVALHTAKHGTTDEKPLRDLARAIDRFEPAVWRDSAALAREVDAEGAFGAGLRLLPRGRVLADELELRDQQAVKSLLTAEAAPGPAIRLEQFASVTGWRAKVAFVLRTLLPAPSYMRLFRPLARRSAAGLALAYILRPFGLARDALPAWRVWRGARTRVWPGGRREP